MNKEEILQKARNEKKPQQCDERQKGIFDKSFYWAFLGTLFCSFVFSFTRTIKGEVCLDFPCTVTFAASCAFVYRFIRDRKKRDLIFSLIMISCFGFLMYRYITGYLM